ncbi:AraC family transcriptional regulator [Vallitalea okinawensis]|uniref:AraC family transcriptional regulator n=1 Tax=Vallitalea okinawensis TaxID=2078660 RepID=UPI000CFAC50E|nr:AraC family transcriptional regulator [Vallitalea okinawensis]
MNQYLLRSYLNNLSVDYITGDKLHVGDDWKDMNYIPDYNKFYLIESGEGWLKIGDEELFPKAYQLVYMPANVKQSYSYINANKYTKYWCHFTAKIGERNIFEVIQLPYILKVTQEQFSYLVTLFSRIYEWDVSHEVASSLKVKALLYELIAFFIDNSVIDQLNIQLTPSSSGISKILLYIEDHIADELTVASLAKQAHLHPNYFIKLFKSYMGASPMHYINKRRVDRAKDLLLSSNSSITQIAEQVGFKDSAYFSKVFKNHTQLTPRQYKQMKKLNDK